MSLLENYFKIKIIDDKGVMRILGKEYREDFSSNKFIYYSLFFIVFTLSLLSLFIGPLLLDGFVEGYSVDWITSLVFALILFVILVMFSYYAFFVIFSVVIGPLFLFTEFLSIFMIYHFLIALVSYTITMFFYGVFIYLFFYLHPYIFNKTSEEFATSKVDEFMKELTDDMDDLFISKENISRKKDVSYDEDISKKDTYEVIMIDNIKEKEGFYRIKEIIPDDFEYTCLNHKNNKDEYSLIVFAKLEDL